MRLSAISRGIHASFGSMLVNSVVATSVAGLLFSSVAMAAESESANSATVVDNMERISVLGSRSSPRSRGDSPVPVDIIGGDELSKSASSDLLEQLVSSIPSFSARAQPISDAASLIRPVNLRGLPSDSTLILVNGKRRHRASVIAFQGGGINDGAQGSDISVIPSAALKQVEVLRDGAAAQYGSDAIAGVMNFVLKDDAEGGSLSVKQGEYFAGDGDTTTVDGNIGLPLTQDGFANLSFQYKTADATSRSVQRTDGQQLIDAGFPEVGTPAQIWGNPEIKDDLSIFANLGMDLGYDKQAYLFGNYSKREITGGFYYRNPTNRGNVYSLDEGANLLVGDLTPGDGSDCGVVPIPYNLDGSVGDLYGSDAYQQNVANDANCFAVNEMFPGGYTPQFGGTIIDSSVTMGTKGDVDDGFFAGMSYDLSGSIGRNHSKFSLNNTINPSLGPDSPTSFNTGEYIQLEKTVNLDLIKELDLGLFDSPINLAGGLEWRDESFEIVAGDEASWKGGALKDQGFAIGSHGFPGFGPESEGENSRKNIAAYLDAEAYLSEDLLLGAAIRYEDYNTFGDTFNYKLTGQYSLTDELSLRGSFSTGFRAPTVGQANVVNTQTTNVDGQLVQSALYAPTHPLSQFYGGTELTPEESESKSIGLVYENNGFFMTADYYHIEVSDRLAQTDKFKVDEGDHAALRELGIDNPELIDTVSYFANDFDTTTQGLDVVANYSMDLLSGDALVSLAYNWNETKVDRYSEATGDFKAKRLEESMPEHRGTVTLAQSWDRLSMFVRGNYFGEYLAVHADSSDFTANASDAVTLDLEVSYMLFDSLTLSAGASNLFDQDAERLDDGADRAMGASFYESGPFDYNGGFYYTRVSYEF